MLPQPFSLVRLVVPLSGGTSYKLNLPKKILAANFWSVTCYDAENSSGLDIRGGSLLSN